MKKSILLLMFVGAAVMLLTGCFKDSLTKTYKIMRPVLKDKSEVLSSIRTATATEVEKPGKMFLLGRYIFLNEVNEGVHIIDNSNPSAPVNKAFISIPGNVDIAVKGNTLYADMFTDLLVLDISDPMNVVLKDTVAQVFPERVYDANSGLVIDPSQVVVDWIEKDTTVQVSNGFQWPCRGCFMIASSDAQNGNKTVGGVPGMAGSMSRMVIVNDYLYAVNNSSLETINISQPQNPAYVQTAGLGWNIETIYPFKNKLFIGSTTGMFIFDIANPAAPAYQGSFVHANACDPVVANDTYAFVTLRSGNRCVNIVNQLDIVDVTNVMAPSLVKTFPMTNPHGLAIDGDLLFICDGADGLKVYNTSSVMNIALKQHIKGIETYDAIAWNKILYVSTKTGLMQYDYTNSSNLRLLSVIQSKK